MPRPSEADIRSKLEDLVSSGNSGQRLPSERVLAQHLGVARMTLRRFIEAFIRDGRLERRQGSGTYIRRPMIASRMQLASFTDEMVARGLVPSSIVVENETIHLQTALATALNAPVGCAAQRVTRVRCGDGEPIAVEIVTIPEIVGITLTDEDLEGSIYRALLEKHDVNVLSASVDISVATPSAYISSLLHVEPNVPLMRIEMIDIDSHGRRLMAATCWYRADRYHVKLRAGRESDKASA